MPETFRLHQNFPNPFNATTQIRYEIPASVPVAVKIYDVRGELVRVLVDGIQQPGEHVARWDGRSLEGRPAGSGLYFCSLQAGDHLEVVKMVLLR
jgi:flagellar hook assembly protein FlgD